MYCPKCGAACNDEWKFCAYCTNPIPQGLSDEVKQHSEKFNLQLPTSNRSTEAKSDPVSALVYGLGSAVERAGLIILVSFVLFLFVPALGGVAAAFAIAVFLIRSFIGAKNYREGFCPNCGKRIQGITRDDALNCKTCKSRIIVNDTKFMTAQ